jgi:hypothetical protein
MKEPTFPSRFRSGVFLLAVASICFTGSVLGQGVSDVSPETWKAELRSPWIHEPDGKARYEMARAAHSCVYLVGKKGPCQSGINISYGNRFGDNWDIIALHGTQSRMIDLGKAESLDEVEVPYIVPFRVLAPGEKRNISINTSGGDGADGKPGRNADGTYPPQRSKPKKESYFDKPVAKQVSSTIKTEHDEIFEDKYNPFLEARKGHVYAIRILEGEIDQYFLMRVDDVEKGEKITVTVKKVSTPVRPPVY